MTHFFRLCLDYDDKDGEDENHHDDNDDDQGTIAEILYEDGDSIQAETKNERSDAAGEEGDPPDADADADFDAEVDQDAEEEEEPEAEPHEPPPPPRRKLIRVTSPTA